MMDRKSKDDNTPQSAIDEFLKNGGEITYCTPGERTEEIEFKGGFYGRKKKKKEPEDKA